MYLLMPSIVVSSEDSIDFHDFIVSLGVEENLRIFEDRIIFQKIKSYIGPRFENELSAALLSLNDFAVGCCSVDFEYSSGDDGLDSFISACFLTAFSSLVFDPVDDPITDLPFTVYTSSSGNEESLKSKGVKFHSPNAKLGFHNDGCIDGSLMYVPDYISLFNIFIGYNDPGKFYWVPMGRFESYREIREKYECELEDSVVRITPIVYDLEEANDAREFSVKIFSHDNGQDILFINGEVVGDERKIAVYNIIKNEILNNKFRYFVPQKIGRLILLSNKFGLHARDIFGGQNVFDGVTRAYVRMMSRSGTQVGARVSEDGLNKRN